MNKVVKIVFVVIFIGSCLNAQSITWQRTYGDAYPDFGYSIVQTPDEGFIAVGRKSTPGDTDIIALRLDKFGNVIWTRFYRGFRASEIIKANDDNYLIGGTPILKININGDTIWTRPQTIGSKFKLTSDGGFYLSGGIENGPFLVYPYLRKFDSLGYLQWDKIYNQTYIQNIYDGSFYDLIINEDKSLTLIGNYSDSAYITDKPFIMKTDSIGKQIWFHKYDSLRYHYLNYIYPHNDGGYIVSGLSFFLKFNLVGHLQWKKYYINSDTTETMRYLTPTFDGGFAATGYYHVNKGNEPYYVRLLKTDSNGNKEWSNYYGFNDADYGYSVKQTSDSGFIIIGYREHYQNGDIYIIKTDKTGYADPPVGINTSSTQIPKDFSLYQNYPNPFNPKTIINYSLTGNGFVTLKIYDVLGKELMTLVNEKQNAGNYSVIFNGNNLPNGVYFYRIETGSFNSTKRMVLIK